MSKDILSVNFEIPGFSSNFVKFTSNKSLMDADILLYNPNILPEYDSKNSQYLGLNSYSDTPSFEYKRHIEHWKKEMKDFLNNGKTIFVLGVTKQDFYIQTGKKEYNGTGRNRQTTNYVDEYNNYKFLPINIGNISKANGSKINCNDSNFELYLNNFKNYVKYDIYLENISNNGTIIYTGKDKNKILGAYYKEGNGYLVLLPSLEYKQSDFTKYNQKEDKEYWNEKGLKFGNILVDFLVKIDKYLLSEGEKTILPDWVKNPIFCSKKENKLFENLKTKEEQIKKLIIEKEQIDKEILSEQELKNLLFEQGKPLENAVIKALNILGFNAENYDDGKLELDQVILSPEGHRYIGECEGKDNKDINITKYRQLLESINRDFDRDEVNEKAFGILFGNPYRLTQPEKREGDFTDKCKTGAKGDKIALIKTEDLFYIVQYLQENKNESFKKKCRESIYKGLGGLVKFPSIPKK